MGMTATDSLEAIAGAAEPDPSDEPVPMIGHGYFVSGLKLVELAVNKYPPVGSSNAAAG